MLEHHRYLLLNSQHFVKYDHTFAAASSLRQLSCLCGKYTVHIQNMDLLLQEKPLFALLNLHVFFFFFGK